MQIYIRWGSFSNDPQLGWFFKQTPKLGWFFFEGTPLSLPPLALLCQGSTFHSKRVRFQWEVLEDILRTAMIVVRRARKKHAGVSVQIFGLSRM